MTTFSEAFTAPRPRTRSSEAARAIAATLLATIGAWHARSRQRQSLAQFDRHLLQDIGLSRSEQRVEIAKPFWRL